MHPRLLSMTAGAAIGVVALAGCGGSSSPNAAGKTGENGGTTTNGTPFSVVSGMVSSTSASTLQVTTSSGTDSLVNYSSSTSIRQEHKATKSALADGVCARITPETGSRAAISSSTATKITAATVDVIGKNCALGTAGGATTGQFGGGPGGTSSGGGPGSFGGGTPPSGFPTTRPSGGSGFPGRGSGGFPGRRGAFRSFGALGRISHLSGNNFVVTSLGFAGPGGAAGATTGGSSASPRKVTVTVTDATAYDETATVQGAAIKIGDCVVAVGTTDAGGDLTARSIQLSSAVDGKCRTASTFGGGDFGGPSVRTGGAGA